jgi:drug/metabolite transporter (DMT)-like permease
MAALYRGLSIGRAAIVAPISGVVGAALPVLVSYLLEGSPGAVRIAGMAAGMLGIWFVSKPARADTSRAEGGLLLGILAGMGFGGFFVLVAQVQHGLLFSPLAVAKLSALCAVLLILAQQRRPFPAPGSNPVALLAGLLDAGGNVLYLLAKQLTRLDIAAVLSSMYPAATVILAEFILHEKVSMRQWLGVGLCMTAVALISL